jgi:beta-glucosidase/6-phospho-beta-glucosidase/beta-galactosidase
MTQVSTFHPSLFRSFWMGGFESACHITRAGTRLDMLAATQHDRFVADDYRRLREMRIETARDTVRWHLVEQPPHRYDFTSVEPFVAASNATGVQVIWDLLHYGWPDDLDIFSADFVPRFAAYSAATARFLRDRAEAARFYTPINEISFFAWAAAEVGWFHPFAERRGGELKQQLVRAWIASVDAIRSEDPGARFVSVEPLIHTVPPLGREDDGRAAGQNASQWEAWDMLAGRRDPELGGAPGYLDIVGVNFYHDNQWEVPGGRKIHWHIKPRDPRWVPLHRLLLHAYQRYERPFLIAETSHVGVGRAAWIRELTDEVSVAIAQGLPIEGICLYPIIDRFEWENPSHWHNSGLWDFAAEPDGTFRRVLNEEYARELRQSQMRLAALGFGSVEPREATA